MIFFVVKGILLSLVPGKCEALFEMGRQGEARSTSSRSEASRREGDGMMMMFP